MRSPLPLPPWVRFATAQLPVHHPPLQRQGPRAQRRSGSARTLDSESLQSPGQLGRSPQTLQISLCSTECRIKQQLKNTVRSKKEMTGKRNMLFCFLNKRLSFPFALILTTYANVGNVLLALSSGCFWACQTLGFSRPSLFTLSCTLRWARGAGWGAGSVTAFTPFGPPHFLIICSILF